MRNLMLGVLGALLMPVAAIAGDATEPPFAVVAALADPAASHCELHVWPAPALQSIVEGFWAVAPVRSTSLGSPELTILPPQRQLDLLPTSQLTGALHMPLGQIVPHPAPMPRSAVLTPVASSSAACSADLVLQRTLYEKGAMTSGSIRVFGTVRRWDKGQLAWTYTGLSASETQGFPPRTSIDAATSTSAAETAWSNAIVGLATQAIAKHPRP